MVSLETTHTAGAINRAPLFDSTNYTYWKARMKVFLLSTDYDAWHSLEFGYH